MMKISEKMKGRLIAAGIAVGMIAVVKFVAAKNVPFIGGIAQQAAKYL